jgi:hypothetical protein
VKPVDVYIRGGHLPNDETHSKHGVANPTFTRAVTSAELDEASTVFIGVTSEESNVHFDITAATFPSAYKIADSESYLEVRVDKDGVQTFLVPYTSSEPVDLIVSLEGVDGLLDIYTKKCGGDLSSCGATEDEMATALDHLDQIRFMKRVHKDHRLLIDSSFSSCSGSKAKKLCWLGVSIRGRMVSSGTLAVQVNKVAGEELVPQKQYSLQSREITLFRYEVKSLATSSLLFAIDCELTNCEKFEGSIRVSRISPAMPGYPRSYDMHVSQENYKYPISFNSYSQLLAGLYYVEIAYTA